MATTQEYNNAASFLKSKDLLAQENTHNSDSMFSHWSQSKASRGIFENSLVMDNYCLDKKKASVSNKNSLQKRNDHTPKRDPVNWNDQKHRTTLLFLKDEEEQTQKKPEEKIK